MHTSKNITFSVIVFYLKGKYITFNINFLLESEYLRVLQSGQETDFILVSCTGLGIETSRREQVLRAKKVCSFLVCIYAYLFFCGTTSLFVY